MNIGFGTYECSYNDKILKNIILRCDKKVHKM